MSQETRSADQVLAIFAADPGRLQTLAADPHPIDAMRKVVDEAKAVTPAWYGDILVYRIAIVVLGVLGLTAAAGVIALALGDKAAPDALVALGSAAIGGLVGIFAQSPISK